MNKNIFYFFLYIILVAVGIPWYWPKDSQSLLLGVPIWVIIAIFCSLLASILTAYILIKPNTHEEK